MVKRYSFSDYPEHKALLPEWTAKSIAAVLNCTPMDNAERKRMRVAAAGLYQAAKLPPPEAVVFVSSPLAGAVVATVAGATWWLHDNPQEAKRLFGYAPRGAELRALALSAANLAFRRGLAVLRGEPVPALVTDVATDVATSAATSLATRGATYAATDGATDGATRGATYLATRGATDAATDVATRRATDDATYDATRRATDDATYIATYVATYAATDSATYAAPDGATCTATDVAAFAAIATRGATDPIICWMIGCTKHWSRLYNGGNFWAGHCHRLSFFRDVAKLPLDYTNYNHYATLTAAGPRYSHPKFCIISDRPEFIHRDARNRPHCSDGPHIKWRDGVELHYIHGIRVTPRITAGQFTVQEIRNQSNAEVRRVMIDRYNVGDPGRYLRDAGAVVLHQDVDPVGHPRRLLQIEQQGDEAYVGVELTNSTPEPDGTHKIYTLRCGPQLRPMVVLGIRSRVGRPQEMTCHNAVASLAGFYGCHYTLAIET
jgi:hypothetical protein